MKIGLTLDDFFLIIQGAKETLIKYHQKKLKIKIEFSKLIK
jgi:hypothetical protein